MGKLRKHGSMDDSAALLSGAMINWLANTDPVDIWPTCATCSHLDTDDRTCKKYGAQPPVSVVVKGCEQYTDSFEIPF